MAKSFRLDGIDKDAFQEFWKLKVPEEQLELFRKTRNGILVGKRVWDHYRWEIGAPVQLGTLNDVASVVCGVYDTGGSALDSRALADRRFIQEALNKQGIVNNILVKVDHVKNAEEVIRTIDGEMTFAKKTETLSESTLFSDLLKELGDLRSTAGMISAVALIAVFFGIWNTLSMTVRDRAQEFGVLRTIGFTKTKVVWLVVMEGGAIAGAGGILSIPLIYAGTAAFSAIYGDITFMGVVVPVTVRPESLALCVPLALLLGLTGSIVPAIAASRRPVVEALRSVD